MTEQVADEMADEMRRKLEAGLTPADMGWPDLTPEELVESERRSWLEEEAPLNWWHREQAIWGLMNGCGHTYDSEGRRLD